MAFNQRQPAGFREQIDLYHRLVVDLEIVSRDNIAKHPVLDMGPRRQRASARAAYIPTHAAHRRKIDCRALDLEDFLSRNEEQRLSRS